MNCTACSAQNNETAKRFSLHSIPYVDELGPEVELFMVCQTAENGLITRLESFGDDFHAAQYRLHELWWIEHPSVRAASEGMMAMTEAIRVADSARVRDLLAPGFRLVNHRPMLRGEYDADDYVEHAVLFSQLGGSLRIIGREVHRATSAGIVNLNDVYATDSTGMVTHHALALVQMFEDGRFVLSEEFEAEDLDLAIARFDELTAGDL